METNKRKLNLEPDRLSPVLDHEKMRVYQLALEFHAFVMRLLPKRGYSKLRQQMEEASLSIVNNIAEGAGRRSAKEKRHFYSIARGSTTESAAMVDVIRVRKIASSANCFKARAMAIQMVRMLSVLSQPTG